MQVIVDGSMVDYQQQGSGRTLVLLHGWNDSAAGLVNLRNQLAKKYQVITPDLPGFGNSQAPDGVWGLNDYANFVAEFVKKIKATDLYAVIGHSNGGAVAVHGLATGQLKADKLVLLASAGIRTKDRGKLTAIKLTTKVGKIILLPLPKATKEKIRRRLYKQIGSDMLVAEHMTDSFKKIVSEDIQSDAAKLKLPTLLIYGEDDNQTPPSYGQLLHELIDASSLEVLPGAGHFVHKDRPLDVVKLIEDYL